MHHAAGALVAARGHAAPETGRAFARARELCRGPGDAGRRVRVLFGLAVYHVNRAEAQEGLAAAEEAMALAPRQDAATRLVAHRAMAIALWHIGRMTPARGHLERMLALFDPARDRGAASAAAYSIDARVMALTFLAKALLCLGLPEQALARAREAIAEARALGHAHSLAQALATAGCRVDCFARDDDGLAARAEEVVALCDERGFPFYGTTGLVYRGWALVGAGRAVEGIRRMEEGLQAYRATGAETFVPHFLGLLADAHGRAGEPGRGLGLLDEALGRVERSGERWFEAELHRIRGGLLRALAPSPGRAAEAEAGLARAVACARREGVRWWELRAATSLARLLRDQGRMAEARGLLAPVYASFTEGFAFPDLVEAKALLDELGAAPAKGADRGREEDAWTSRGPDRPRGPAPDR